MTPPARVLGFLPEGAGVADEGELILHGRAARPTSRASSARRATSWTRTRCAHGRARYLAAFRSRTGRGRGCCSRPRPSNAPRSTGCSPRRDCAVTWPAWASCGWLWPEASPRRDIYVHGNAKTDQEIRAAIDHGVGTFIVDNCHDIDRLEKLAPAGQQVMVRVVPDIAVATHESMVTGQPESKFGLPEPQARAAIARLSRSKLTLIGPALSYRIPGAGPGLLRADSRGAGPVRRVRGLQLRRRPRCALRRARTIRPTWTRTPRR